MTKTQNTVKTLNHFIGGVMTPGKSERFGNVYAPSTGELIGLCPLATTEEVNETVEVAHTAFEKWKRILLEKELKYFIALEVC